MITKNGSIITIGQGKIKKHFGKRDVMSRGVF